MLQHAQLFFVYAEHEILNISEILVKKENNDAIIEINCSIVIFDILRRVKYMLLMTERLVLRPWMEKDAESLFEYAKDPDVGPIAGWPPHKNVDESLHVIRNVLKGAECYAICEKGSNTAIGAVELKLNGDTDMTEKNDECELGYWLGKPFWGRGYMTEAAAELIRHGFEELGITTIWCGYYDGNYKSKRVQEKLGFVYHHTCDKVPVSLMNEIRIGHTNYMTKEQWLRQ